MTNDEIRQIQEKIINSYNKTFKLTSVLLKVTKASDKDEILILGILDSYLENVTDYIRKRMED